MTNPANAYRCPGCGTGADLTGGCPGCGRGPDPVAAEVTRLDAEIVGLTERVFQAGQAYQAATVALQDARQRREMLARQVRSALRATPPPRQPPPEPAAAAPAGTVPVGPTPAPVRPEASTRTVQNVLFVLGGLLLGTAAVVFTVVAWATVGIAGRASILAGLTTLALAGPVLARRRGLTATAETFAAIGLLLVVLDGYAVWAVGLFGVDGWPTARYAALVGGASAAVAAGYRRWTGLAAPWFAGLLLLQPVVPLLALDAGVGVAGWTVAFAGLAAVNLGLTRGRGGDGPAGRLDLARRSVAGTGYGLALLAAAGCGAAALVTGAPTAALAGGPLLLTALVLLAGALRLRVAAAVAVAGGVLVVVLATGLLRAVAASPWPPLVSGALAVTALAGALAVLLHRLPPGVRIGPRAGGLLVTGALAAVTGLMTLTVALAVVLASQPLWSADLAARTGPFDWQLPVAVPLATAALGVLLPRRAWRPTLLTGAVLTLLALPTAVPLPWWAISTLDLVLAAGFALAAVRRDRSLAAAVSLAGAAVPLAGHAVLVGLARPGGAAAVLGGLVLTGAAVALVALRSTGSAHRRTIGGCGLAAAVLAAPAGLTLGLFAAGVPPWWQARAVLAAAVLLCAGLLPLRRAVPGYLPYAGAALSLVALPVGLSPALPGVAEPGGMYAAGALLITVTVLLLCRTPVAGTPVAGTPATQWAPSPVSVSSLLSGAVLLTRAGIIALPAVGALLVAPYGWIGRIWSGPPAGVGLGPEAWRPDGHATLTLLLLTVAGAAVGLFRRTDVRFTVLVTAPLALATALAGLAAAGARWPTVPALTLLGGLVGLLAVALGTSERRTVRTCVPLGVLFGAAGLAGLLPAEGTTLGGLALVGLAGLTAGAAGRLPAARVAGWLTAVAAGVAAAIAACLAADLPARIAALAVLGVAALALAGGTALRGPARSAASAVPPAAGRGERGAVGGARRAEAVAVEAAGHLAALGALVLTVGAIRHAAVVCTLWGVALGLRALRPGEPAGRRWTYTASAAGAELAATWLLLSAARVALVEAYTLPAAVLGVLAGWLALRAWPALSSWIGYGPGLGAALLPSLVSVLVMGEQPWRRLLLGAGALVVVLAGARWRRQAPVVLGGGVLAVLALREMVDVWDLLPRWIFLAVGGSVLIGLAMTYERRRRDLRRLRSAVTRMS
ncbi:SCO7613 C-terminal domain-containing membrane protein [Plantactinospora sp. CA-290183]|uniref:SCO7613 C-terminal domain-containing membrane protein n=1 Tax=Plantactinospora sp. CA-290183 TaxID=3240006 RepID=UPI003D93A509